MSAYSYFKKLFTNKKYFSCPGSSGADASFSGPTAEIRQAFINLGFSVKDVDEAFSDYKRPQPEGKRYFCVTKGDMSKGDTSNDISIYYDW